MGHTAEASRQHTVIHEPVCSFLKSEHTLKGLHTNTQTTLQYPQPTAIVKIIMFCFVGTVSNVLIQRSGYF